MIILYLLILNILNVGIFILVILYNIFMNVNILIYATISPQAQSIPQSYYWSMTTASNMATTTLIEILDSNQILNYLTLIIFLNLSISMINVLVGLGHRYDIMLKIYFVIFINYLFYSIFNQILQIIPLSFYFYLMYL